MKQPNIEIVNIKQVADRRNQPKHQHISRWIVRYITLVKMGEPSGKYRLRPRAETGNIHTVSFVLYGKDRFYDKCRNQNKNNIKFLDLNLKSNMDKMQFDYSEDAADTVHVNILGAKKITKFVGQYIADNYKLTDYRKTDNSCLLYTSDAADE